MKTPQQQVAENTAARGYRDGWTAEQFAARQVCKLVEELAELSTNIWTGSNLEVISYWEQLICTAGEDARRHFDNVSRWDVSSVTAETAKSELADIQVVVFNLAAALAEITGEPFDVVQAAVDKSAADIERGKR